MTRAFRIPLVAGVAGLALAILAAPVGADGGIAAMATTVQIPAQQTSPAPAHFESAVAITAAPNTSPATVLAAQARIARLLPARLRSRRVAPYLGSNVSVRVEDALTGHVIWSRSSTLGKLPASNMKLITAATVLQTFGPAHRWVTKVVSRSGSHDLVLIAGGDPLLTSTDLDSLAARTAEALLPPPGPSTTPTPTPVPVAYTLHFDDTMFAPPSLATGWSRSQVPNTIRPVRALVRDRRVLNDTGADAAAFFSARLRAHGLNVTYRGRIASPSSTKLLPIVATLTGHSVLESVRRMLMYSDNNVAEMLLRDAAVGRGRAGSWLGGRQAIAAALTRLGVIRTGLRTYDGSGLSRSDRVPARVFTAILRAAVTPVNSTIRVLFAGSVLPVAGISGTLESRSGRFNTAPSKCARGLIWAKTGSLHDVIGLSGYARGRDGHIRVFSILVNARPQRYAILSARRGLDRIAATITGCW